MSEQKGLGGPCWIEIPARDLSALKKFYAAVFPQWTWMPGTEEHPEEHVAGFKFQGPDGLSGGIVAMPKDVPPHSQSMGAGFTVYFLVDTIEKATERIHAAGGKTVLDKKPESSNGWFANLTDIEGNRFGIYEVNRHACESTQGDGN